MNNNAVKDMITRISISKTERICIDSYSPLHLGQTCPAVPHQDEAGRNSKE